MEIERKFLVRKNYEQYILSLNLESHQIEQFYVQVGETEERYRKTDNSYFHTTKKSIDGGLKREEIETECTQIDFETNLRHIIGLKIEKTRHFYFFDSYNLEIDFYLGSLKGLVVCEVEFKSEGEAKTFVPPEFLGAEVTLDKRYKNQSLALNGLPTGC